MAPYGLKVYTRLNGTVLEKDIARVEVRFRQGEATGSKHMINPDLGTYRYDAWTGQLSLQVTTPAQANDNTHGRLRAVVRNYAAQLDELIALQPALMPFHCINDLRDTGTSPVLKSEDGYEYSTLAYKLFFNIRTDVWPS